MIKLFSKIRKYTSSLDTHYRIGMRVIKTAIAVMICLLISLITKSNDIMQISAVSALITLRATQKDTLHTGVFRMLGTIIGGLFGMATVLAGLFLPFYSEGLYVIVIPLVIIANLYTCNFFKMQDSCVISCVVTLIVASQVNLQGAVSEALVFTLLRIRDTLIGVLVATVMNTLPILHKRTDISTSEDQPHDTCEK